MTSDKDNNAEENIPEEAAGATREVNHNEPYVIGIGASAGGLQALHVLFEHIPPDSVSYVVVQHMSPDHRSLLAEILARESVLKIQEAQDGMPVGVNQVYIMPSDKQVTIQDNILHLAARPAEPAIPYSIDTFFKSLAVDKGKKAIGIILSGIGNDGSGGIVAIKKAGGLVLVQDPETAKYDGMPRHAIQSGYTDFVLPPELMPDEIFNHVKIAPLTQQVTAFIDNQHEETLNQILSLVHDRTGLDFLNYKRPTIIRRISRRMAITNLNSLTNYLDYLQLHPEEIETISKEFLIGVTKFFRDEEAFEVIQRKAIPNLVEGKSAKEQLRVWVAGCSTGEEAYSLAILAREYLEKVKSEIEVKIFASDIDREALEFAGRGLYPYNVLTELSEDRLLQHFVKEDGKFRVCQVIRKMVIFSHHNIISDPPFSKMDLVSCRNMLIYLNPQLQKKIITKFHYALQEGGYLFLGSSESVGDLKNFVEVNKKWKIFRNVEPARPLGLENFSTSVGRSNYQLDFPRHSRELSPKVALTHLVAETLNETILEELGYAAVYVNQNFDVIHGAGDYNKYLTLPDKALTMNLLKMVPPDLALNLGTLLRKAVRDKEKISMKGVQVRDKGLLRRLDVVIKPYLDDKRLQQKFVLVLLSEEKSEPLTIEDPERYWYEQENEGRVSELEMELQHTKEDLQLVVEELETANEELQSTNEELLSSNEELQSTNEELQSLNEELHTINAEHQYKIKVLMELDDDLNNYFRSTNISQIFVDLNLEIRKYTPAATQQINLIESDIGRSIYQISNNLKYDGLVEDIRRVIASPATIEKEVQDKEGIWYQMRILPYITQTGKIDGAIILFVKINELKNLHLLQTGILDSSMSMIQVFKAVRGSSDHIVDFEWTMVNAKAQEFLNRPEAEVIGKRFRREFPGMLRIELFDRLVQIVETQQPLELEVEQDHEGHTYWFHLIAVKLNDGLVLTLENITERKQAEHQLVQQADEIRESAERFRLLSEAIPLPTWTTLPDGYANSYNQNWHQYTGLTLEQSIGWGWTQALHPDYREQVISAYRKSLQTGETYRVETLLCRHDNTYRWHLNYAVPIKNEEGAITLWIGTATDIHEQKVLIQELEENRHFIRQITETSPDFIYVYDLAQNNNVFLNRNLAEMLGYDPNTFLDTSEFSLFRLVHPEDLPQVQDFFKNFHSLVGKEIKEIFYRVIDAAGEIRWFRDRAMVFLHDENNQSRQVVGIAQDVTESIMWEQQLKSEKEFSENLLDNSIDGIVAFDKNACITSWNMMMEVLNGILKEEVIGKNIFDLFPEYHFNDEGRAIHKALNGEKTVLHDHPYGLREGYFETSTIPLFNDKGEVIGGLSTIHDITERKRLEDERINLRLHQQKAVLNAILETQETERKRISESLHNGLGQLLYATKLKIADLQLESAHNKELKRVVDDLLDDAIKETRQLSFELMPSILRDFGLEAALGEICKRVSSSKLQVQCEVIGLKERLDDVLETALFRISQELLNNILKHAQATEANIQVVKQKSKLVLRVEDNGEGFEVQKVGLGGLGLSSIRNRLVLVDGSMNIDSEPGQGSRFTIIIPANKHK
ncbi:CheR family methyltransferase [Adhaeribacter pallidiroseus]|uniref:protein-glutamate O-methyltransferase n=1 Tax=Adhaeribacter pallidiroseus TaxID=2072847 RepID=A0A369QHY7_9BACT|nr:CheR family methyltransferase [Adhaeribacter pallidiroseus]RDC63195.1 Protein-glutamate methylesterase [Adhaeribacter pallidiroseus]